MEVYVLGSAAGIPTRNRHCTSIAIASNELLWLMDCGEPVSGQLVRAGLSPLQVDMIFISHFHTDHVSGLPLLIQVCQLRRRKRPLTIYAPDNPEERIWTILKSLHLEPEKLPFKINIVEVPSDKPSMILESSRLKVGSIPTVHPPVPSVAYSLYAEGKKVFFSGDLKISDSLVEFAYGSDLLILEAAHNPLDDIGRFVDMANPKILLINHIHPKLDEAEAEINYAIQKYYNGRILIAKDLMRITL